MKRPAFFLSVFFLSLFIFPLAFAAEEKTPPKSSRIDLPTLDIFSNDPAKIEAVADQIEYTKENKKTIAKGNVVIRYQDNQLTSDEAEIDNETKEVYAHGHVIVFHKGQPIGRGEEIHYNFKNHSGDFGAGQAVTFPWFIKGDDIQQVRKGVKTIKNGSITTCNYEKPHYEIRARNVTIYDNDKIVAKNIRLYVLGKPIFWWPYFIIPIDQFQNAPISVVTGYNSRLGYYLETTKSISINEHIGGAIQADVRTLRGFGGGGRLNYNYGKPAKGMIKGYWTQDKRAPRPGADNPYRDLRNHSRGRITWLHRTDIDPNTNVILRYNRIEDQFFLQDFFRKESRAEIEPQSFITATRNTERFGLMTHLEKQMNRFESVVERLPEVRFDWKDQPFFQPWLFYENQVSYNNLATRIGRSPNVEDANRFDNFHQWSVPLNWKDIQFTPVMDVRGTYYSRNVDSGSDRFRAAWGIGSEVRTHFYRLYPTVFEKWGIEVNQLRHLIEPSIQYHTTLTNLSSDKVSHFDSVDRADTRHTVTFGIENRLQTKRVVGGRMQRVDIVSLNTFLSYELLRDSGPFTSFLTDSDEGRSNGNYARRSEILSEDIILRPYNWLQYHMRLDYNFRRVQWNVVNQDLVFNINRYQFSFGHRLLRDIGTLRGSNQFAFEGRMIINPLWSVSGYFRWDLERDNTDEWQLSATRDLHDFILDFGYNVRNSGIQSSNKEVFVNFHLKAFPLLELRSGNKASFGQPRIGNTVAGANEMGAYPYHFDEGVAGPAS